MRRIAAALMRRLVCGGLPGQSVTCCALPSRRNVARHTCMHAPAGWNCRTLHVARTLPATCCSHAAVCCPHAASCPLRCTRSDARARARGHSWRHASGLWRPQKQICDDCFWRVAPRCQRNATCVFSRRAAWRNPTRHSYPQTSAHPHPHTPALPKSTFLLPHLDPPGRHTPD